ncbi:MAG TPA: MFS transporter [Micropruina sp.]|nr:MFS transporter [Micropruina sp.]
MPPHVPYPVLLRTMGGSFTALGIIGRLPASILPLALLLYAQSQLGSFALAGLATAALSLGGAAGAVFVGHLADTRGHRLIGVGATLVQTLAMAGFLFTCRPDAPLAVPLGCAALIGFANPQVGGMARARWSQAATQRADRTPFTSAAMAWEGAVDEVSFVVGPVIATTLAAVAPALPVIIAMALAWIGQVGFALHRTALPPAHEGRLRHEHSPEHIDWTMLVLLGVVTGAVGLLFGSTQTSLAAFFTLRDEQAVTGLVYGTMAVGSATMGLLTNRLPARFSFSWRIVLFGLGSAVVSPLLVFAWDAPSMAVACFLVGVMVGPILVTAYALAERISPPERLSTLMAVLSTIGVVGVAAGAALAGQLVEVYTPQTAAWLATVGALLACVAGLIVTRRLSAGSRSGPRGGSQREGRPDVA